MVSVKWDLATPLAKTVPVSSTITLAPSRLPSVSAGAEANASGVTSAMVKVSSPRSASDMSRSPSWAWTSTTQLPPTVGLPQIVRGAEPRQEPVPSASNTMPSGRFWAW